MRWLPRVPSVLPIDGPVPDLPLVGHALAMSKDPLRLLSKLANDHEDMAPLHLGPLRGFVPLKPELIEQVLRSKTKSYTRRTRVYEAMSIFLGRGILTSEGEHWRKHRRIVQPAFHKRKLRTYAQSIVRLTDEAIESWRGELDASEAVFRLTLEIVGETILGTKTDADAEDIGASVDAGQRYVESIIGGAFQIPLSVPTAKNRSLQRAIATMDRIAYQLIEEKRREPGDDVVSMLVEARDEDGNPLPDKQIRDELVTLIGAGHETTANAMSWTLMLLGKHPTVERKLVDEVRRVLGDRPPTFDDLPKLRYVRWVLDESMRLYPPAWTTGRIAIEPHVLETNAGRKHRIEPDTFMLLSPWILHRKAELWENPEGFDPDRWEALEKPGALPPFAFFPFGGGPRKCVGEAFAYLEATIVLAMIAQRVSFELVPGHPIVRTPQVTLGMKHGLRAIARRRA